MPKVLVLFEFPTLNGGENSWLATVEPLRKLGWEIVAAAPAKGPLARQLDQLQLEHLPLGNRDGGVPPLIERRASLATLVRNCQPDLIHANSLNMARIAGPVARALQIPCVGHARDIVRISKQAVADLNQNSRILCVSHATRQWHVAQGLRPDRSAVLYNGVDLELFRPRQPTGYLHQELQLEPDVPVIGGIGQLVMRKGWDLLIQAAERLTTGPMSASLPPLHFVIAGECYSTKNEARDYQHQLQQRSRQGPLKGRLSFLGRREDVTRLLPELTLLAHPARQEPLGRVLLESVACGVPVVATDVGGTSEIFADYRDAAKIVPPEARAFAAAIRETVLDAAWAARARDLARQLANARFSQSLAAQGLARHYEEVLGTEMDPSKRGPLA